MYASRVIATARLPGRTWPCTRGARCQKFASAGTRNEFRLQPPPIKHHGVDQREPQPKSILQLAGGGQLRHGVVQAGRPRAAAGQPRRHVPGAAAELDAVLPPSQRAAPWPTPRKCSRCPSWTRRGPQPQPPSRGIPPPTGPTRHGCAARDQRFRSQPPASPAAAPSTRHPGNTACCAAEARIGGPWTLVASLRTIELVEDLPDDGRLGSDEFPAVATSAVL